MTKTFNVANSLKKTRYTNSIVKYGLYAVLSLLEECEDVGAFEECAIIRDALIEYSKDSFKVGNGMDKDRPFPTRISQFTKEELKSIRSKKDYLDKVEEDIKTIKKLIGKPYVV